MNHGSLLIKLPDGRVREYLIEKAEISIGRSADNDVLIDDPSVSGRHARIVIETDRASITDANSNDGTFIGSKRVSSMTPSRLFEDQAARIGKVELRFIPPAPVVENLDASAARPTVASIAPALSFDGPPIHLALTGPDRPIEPGDLATATLLVQNRSTVADDLLFQINGIPPDWLRLSRDRVRLLPNEQSKITLMFQPPRGAASIAAEYPFTVNAVSREHRTKAHAAGVLKVLTQQRLALHMLPVRSPQKFQVQVENRGNGEAVIDLSGVDDDQQLAYRFERESITLKPGQQKSIGLQVGPKKKIKAEDRSPKLLSFNVIAKSVNAAQPELQTSGLLVIQPPRRWGMVLLGVLLIMLGLGAAWAYTRYCPQWAFCPSSAKPSITVFTSTPIELQRGGTVVISWDVNNADQVQLIQPDAQTLSKTGVATFNINRSTDFTLRATNAGGIIERTISVGVSNSSP